MTFSGQYLIKETLYESDYTSVYRAKRIKDDNNVIVKVLKPLVKDQTYIAAFTNEPQVLALLKSDKIAKIIDAIHTPSEHIHVYEDIGGKTLFEYLHMGSFSIEEALDIAIELTKGIEYVNSNNIVHTAINPKNIIYNRENKKLRLIDFGFAYSHYRDTNPLSSSKYNDNLIYAAPEQTGKTSRIIDFRSDLYALGMTLYHLFSGKSPFSGANRDDVVHRNLAMVLPPLHTLRESVPKVISEIVQKLTEKKPERRYQSIKAVSHDLKYCQDLFEKKGEIPDFEIAIIDRPKKVIGEHLYGRENEVNVLMNVVAKTLVPSSTCVLISGASGIGKTRLAEEYIARLSSLNGCLIRSKFDQYRMAFPYAIFHDIFEQLTIAWLSKKEGKKISFDMNGAELLCKTFPELTPILSNENSNFNTCNYSFHHQLLFVVNELFNLLATRDFPIVLFIDDLQWADPSSIDLISHLLKYQDSAYFHFIGNFREAEMDGNTSTFEFITYLQEIDTKCTKVHLERLTFEQVHQMIGDLFGFEGGVLDEFVSILDKKSNGNPLCMKTFVEHLIKSDILHFVRGKWKYSIEEVTKSSININIGQLIKEKFDSLSKDEKTYLQYLSIWGNSGNLQETYDAMTSFNLVDSHMKQLDKLGFIEILKDKYKFVNDQVQQYAYFMLDSKMKQKIHLRIGNLLDTKIPNNGRDIVAIVTHLNKGYDQKQFPKKLYMMNIEALKTMLERNAYVRALREIRWMEAHDFEEHMNRYSQSYGFEFHILKARTLYLNGVFDEVKALLNEMIKRAKSREQKYICFHLYKDLCVTTGQDYTPLLEYAVELFENAGLKVPDSPEMLKESIAELHHYILSRSNHVDFKNFKSLRVIKNKADKQLMELLVEVWEVAYYLADIDLMKWMYLNIITSSLKHGYCSASAFGYVLYGGWLVSEGKYNQGYEFGQIALSINNHFNDVGMLPKIHNFVANFINPYSKSYEENIPLYEKSLYQSKINGNIVFGTWANFLMHLSNFFSGKSLDKLANRMSNHSTFLLNSGDQKMIYIFNYLVHTVHWIQGTRKESFDEEKMISEWEKEKFYPGLAWYAIIKGQNAFLNGEYESGLRCLERHVHSDMNEVIMFPKIRLHFIRALLLMSVDIPLSEGQKSVLKKDIEFFDSADRYSSIEFKIKKMILTIERDKDIKGVWKTSEAYDKALHKAKKAQNNFHIAIIGLCASRFWKTRGYQDMSLFYQNEALFGLEHWGAYSLIQQIKQERTKNALSIDAKRKEENDFNYKTLVKSFMTLSKLTDKKEVIKMLLHLIVQHATASRAVLIFKENSEYFVYADMDFSYNSTNMVSTPLDSYQDIAKSMVRYAINTGKMVVDEEPHNRKKFHNDAYITRKKLASFIVLPVRMEGDVGAVLYLENYELATPLSSQSIKTLELILTQAAILFKNILLYSESQNAAMELNRAQEISRVGSWKFNTNSNEIKWSAETYRIYDLEPNSMKISYEWFIDHLLEEEREKVKSDVALALEQEKEYNVTHRIITAKGIKKYVHQRAEVFWDGDVQKMEGTIQDITETILAQEMIGRFSQVVNQNPFSTLITDTSATIVYVNPQCLSMTSYFEQELVGKKMNIFRSGVHSNNFYEDLWNTISKEKKLWQGTIVNRMKDGRLLDCFSTIFPIFDRNNNITNYVTIQQDVTERNIKDRLFIMQSRQAQMGEMISMIAHQWRQPLAVIGTLLNKERVSLLLEEYNPADLLKNFDNIEHQVQHLSKTIDDFRDFFKPDKEKITTKNSILVSKMLALLEHMIKQKNIEFKEIHTNDEEYEVYEHELVQVLMNLVKNAQDAFEERKIMDRNIIIETTLHQGYSTITVEDNAGGISSSVSESLFLPYVTTKNKHNGTGLGLYMSKAIIEEHCKGELTFQNTLDGAKFTIKIPTKE